MFTALEKEWYSRARIAEEFGVSIRTITAWRQGKTSIDESVFNKLVNLAHIKPLDFSPKYLSDYWYTKSAGRKGGLTRIAMYGNFGTPESRSKGGLISIQNQQKSLAVNGFSKLKSIKYPKHSEALAEFFGILFGDGHVANYQVMVTTNSETDYDHAVHCQKLFKDLFGLSAYIRKKKDQNAVNIVASSRALVEYFHKNGMPNGNKIKNKIKAPNWIMANQRYRKAFVRGLFDTDGCVYLDKHHIKDKDYYHVGWTFTNFADNLIADVLAILKGLGFTPTHRDSQPRVYLRRQKEIARYFSEIGTSNPKHRSRYEKYIAGGVPKRS